VVLKATIHIYKYAAMALSDRKHMVKTVSAAENLSTRPDWQFVVATS